MCLFPLAEWMVEKVLSIETIKKSFLLLCLFKIVSFLFCYDYQTNITLFLHNFSCLISVAGVSDERSQVSFLFGGFEWSPICSRGNQQYWGAVHCGTLWAFPGWVGVPGTSPISHSWACRLVQHQGTTMCKLVQRQGTSGCRQLKDPNSFLFILMISQLMYC